MPVSRVRYNILENSSIMLRSFFWKYNVMPKLHYAPLINSVERFLELFNPLSSSLPPTGKTY